MKGSNLEENEDVHEESTPPAHRIRLPGFIREEIGLGDVVKKATYAMGVKPCSGCHRRAASLNRWLAFSPGDRRQSQ